MSEKKTAPCEQGAVLHKGSQSAELMEVIRVKTSVGKGTDEDPCRIISEFWSKEGKLLATNDPMLTFPGRQLFPD